MPYTKGWNESEPAGTSAAAALDSAIQDLKFGLRERLEQVIPSFGNDGVDPKVLAAGSARVVMGDEEAKPEPDFVGQILYAEDTKRIFIAITLAGSEVDDKWDEVLADVPTFPRAFIIDAGSPEFDPENTLSRAMRVKKAIDAADASAGKVRVVYVPVYLWGYVADGDFNASMFKSTILMVREGAIVPWFDPVAYGADVTGAVNSFDCINTAVSHAQAGATPGMRAVAFTVPGTYRMDGDITWDGTADYLTFPSVVMSGTGEFDGIPSSEWPVKMIVPMTLDAGIPAEPERPGEIRGTTDTKKLLLGIPGTPNEWIEVNPSIYGLKGVDYNADGTAGSRTSVLAIMDLVFVRLKGTANGSGELFLDFTETELAGYHANRCIFAVTTEVEQTGVTSSTSTNWSTLIDPPNNKIKIGGLGGGEYSLVGLVLGFSAP